MVVVMMMHPTGPKGELLSYANLATHFFSLDKQLVC